MNLEVSVQHWMLGTDQCTCRDFEGSWHLFNSVMGLWALAGSLPKWVVNRVSQFVAPKVSRVHGSGAMGTQNSTLEKQKVLELES